MILLTGEVTFPLHSAIVLAAGFIQYDTHPFPGGKEGGADIGNSATLTLPYHLHYTANLGEEEQTRGRHCELFYNNLVKYFFSISSIFCPSCVCIGKVTYLRRFATLHCSCAAHFADQWAGQLEDLGNTQWKKWG